MEDDAREVAGEELSRIRDRLSSSAASTAVVIQFIIVIFAGAIIAAAKYPAAIVILPLFWSVWLLHSLMSDRDTIKFAAYARVLEKKINDSLGVELLVWENRLTERTNSRPLIFQASYVYWALLNLASWVLAIGVLVHKGMWPWAIVLGLLGATVWIVVLVTVKTRDDYAQRQEEILSALEPPSDLSYSDRETLIPTASRSVQQRRNTGHAQANRAILPAQPLWKPTKIAVKAVCDPRTTAPGIHPGARTSLWLH
jgi:hypothetical protein